MVYTGNKTCGRSFPEAEAGNVGPCHGVGRCAGESDNQGMGALFSRAGTPKGGVGSLPEASGWPRRRGEVALDPRGREWMACPVVAPVAMEMRSSKQEPLGR